MNDLFGKAISQLLEESSGSIPYSFPDESIFLESIRGLRDELDVITDTSIRKIVAKTSNYIATISDHTILCGAGNETFTVTLPTALGVLGIIYNIKNTGTGTITVDGNASETIDGSTTAVINVQYASITIQSDGSNWHII